MKLSLVTYEFVPYYKEFRFRIFKNWGDGLVPIRCLTFEELEDGNFLFDYDGKVYLSNISYDEEELSYYFQAELATPITWLNKPFYIVEN